MVFYIFLLEYESIKKVANLNPPSNLNAGNNQEYKVAKIKNGHFYKGKIWFIWKVI